MVVWKSQKYRKEKEKQKYLFQPTNNGFRDQFDMCYLELKIFGKPKLWARSKMNKNKCDNRWGYLLTPIFSFILDHQS